MKDDHFDPMQFLMVSGVDQQVAVDWLLLRKKKKAPPTMTAIRGIIREANKAGMSLNDAIEESCNRGWTGFKAEWVMKDRPKLTQHQINQKYIAASLFGYYPNDEILLITE